MSKFISKYIHLFIDFKRDKEEIGVTKNNITLSSVCANFINLSNKVQLNMYNDSMSIMIPFM